MKTIAIPDGIFPEEGIVAFGVTGDCMTAAGILDGDHVIVDTSAQVDDGDIAVVRSRRGDLVQYVHRLADGLLLVPATPVHPPVRLTGADQPVIAGKVIGIHRDLDTYTRL